MEFVNKYKTAILFTLLLVAIYFPIFLHMDFMPFRMWDESILGLNAIEMSQNHKYLVTYAFGSPDFSNCKPPLMIWAILICSKILGFNEISLRMPSALAALALCIYLFFSLRRYTASNVFPFFVVIILITCQGYVRNHVIRTGEYDSLLVLFSTITALHLFFAVETDDAHHRSRMIFFFFAFLTLAVLTKGVAFLMQAPGLLIYVLFRKKLLTLLKTKALWWGLVLFLVLGLGYYPLRESVNPGYLQAVWENELGGRFGQVNEGHVGPLTFYFNEVITWQFIEYMFLFPIALFIGLRFSKTTVQRLVVFSAITGGMFLIFISVAQTKLPHYDAPLFPYLAIITASLFYFLYSTAKEMLARKVNQVGASLIAFCCIAFLFSHPYYDIISKVYFPHGDSWEEGFSTSCRYFQNLYKGRIPLEANKAVFDVPQSFGPGTVLKCYEYQLQQKGINLQIVNREHLEVGDRIAVSDDYIKMLIEQKFETVPIRWIADCHTTILLLKKEKTGV